LTFDGSGLPSTHTSDQIRGFILEHFPSARGRSLRNDERLLENGLLDSLGVLDLVAYLEREFHVIVSDDELLPEHFENIDRLSTFVDRKRGGSA
jgi:acyl carrier protein